MEKEMILYNSIKNTKKLNPPLSKLNYFTIGFFLGASIGVLNTSILELTLSMNQNNSPLLRSLDEDKMPYFDNSNPEWKSSLRYMEI